MRERVTEAIVAAVLDELAETGYANMSMEAVARRAGAGKAAIYRRWTSKEAMVQHVIGGFAWQAVPVPDTGTLRGDVQSYVAHAADLRRDLRAARIIADIGAEAIRNERLAQTFYTALRKPRRDAGVSMLQRAKQRDELPGNLDDDLALDCLVGLTYARPQSLTDTGELEDPYPTERLTEVILTALAACQR